MTMDEIKAEIDKRKNELNSIKNYYTGKHTLAMREEDITKCDKLMVQAIR